MVFLIIVRALLCKHKGVLKSSVLLLRHPGTGKVVVYRLRLKMLAPRIFLPLYEPQVTLLSQCFWHMFEMLIHSDFSGFKPFARVLKG